MRRDDLIMCAWQQLSLAVVWRESRPFGSGTLKAECQPQSRAAPWKSDGHMQSLDLFI